MKNAPAQNRDRDVTFMHICGTLEAAIARTGLRSLLPERLKIVMGPGCPVCSTPQGEIDAALELVDKDCIVATYGDLLRVPGSKGSLESSGGEVKVVQGIHKAVEIGRKTKKEVVFISVGFETTAPTVAATILTKPPGAHPEQNLLRHGRRRGKTGGCIPEPDLFGRVLHELGDSRPLTLSLPSEWLHDA